MLCLTRCFVRQQSTVQLPALSKLYPSTDETHYIPQLERKRLHPTTLAFYARNPQHYHHMEKLSKMLNKNMTLPYSKEHCSRDWFAFSQYSSMAGGKSLKPSEYFEFKKILTRLDSIDSQLKSNELNALLDNYCGRGFGWKQEEKKPQLDHLGRAFAVGKRKGSMARVYVSEGSGKVLVNGKDIEDAFTRMSDRVKLLQPLELTNGEVKYNIFAIINGGGITGQVDALKLAISKALLIHNPLFKTVLGKNGCLSRDPRVVERKKPGRVKARKMPTWVKR
ncbi:mitochondrial 37S ribosomal protein [Martiniozyma asiatica (nom. inval.)]|nr:mitochondrial 37S ribosomal protein [Martiniozyma asiatica]